MENKYYTPTIEEFHVGFEFEFYDDDDKDWTKTEIKSQSDLCNFTGLLIEKRVKLLDREDVKDLSSFCIGKNEFHLKKEEDEKGEYVYRIKLFDDCIINVIKMYIDESIPLEILISCIKIKNKYELQKLLVQLGIN